MRSVQSDVPKEAMAIFGNLNIHEPIEHNFIGYLGGRSIDDGCLDTVQGAERANVTTFIDFTISKTWLYSSRSERSAKARMYCRTLFSVCRIVRRWICTMFSLRMRSHSCCTSYGFTKLASLHRCIIRGIDMLHTRAHAQRVQSTARSCLRQNAPSR